jgi:hypothetical protein
VERLVELTRNLGGSVIRDAGKEDSDELETIKERHEQEKASYCGQIKGGPQARIPTTRPKPSSVGAQYARTLREEKPDSLPEKAETDSSPDTASPAAGRGRKAAPLIAPKGKGPKGEKSTAAVKESPAAKTKS